VKDSLESIEKRLQTDKEVSKDKKEIYQRVIGEMRYNVGKVADRWPAEIDKIMDNLNAILREFDTQLQALSKGSSLFCGSSGNPKQLESTFRRLAGY
jgi:anion-transporting  ArsA/GET3 family ATPase